MKIFHRRKKFWSAPTRLLLIFIGSGTLNCKISSRSPGKINLGGGKQLQIGPCTDGTYPRVDSLRIFVLSWKFHYRHCRGRQALKVQNFVRSFYLGNFLRSFLGPDFKNWKQGPSGESIIKSKFNRKSRKNLVAKKPQHRAEVEKVLSDSMVFSCGGPLCCSTTLTPADWGKLRAVKLNSDCAISQLWVGRFAWTKH